MKIPSKIPWWPDLTFPAWALWLFVALTVVGVVVVMSGALESAIAGVGALFASGVAAHRANRKARLLHKGLSERLAEEKLQVDRLNTEQDAQVADVVEPKTAPPGDHDEEAARRAAVADPWE